MQQLLSGWESPLHKPAINLYLTFEISIRPTCSCTESSFGPCFFGVSMLLRLLLLLFLDILCSMLCPLLSSSSRSPELMGSEMGCPFGISLASEQLCSLGPWYRQPGMRPCLPQLRFTGSRNQDEIRLGPAALLKKSCQHLGISGMVTSGPVMPAVQPLCEKGW